MTRTYRWIGTTGGPHVLVAKELLSLWRGIEGWRDHRDPADQSDYARACRVTTWLKLIPLVEGHAIVLSGDVGDIAWFPNSADDGGFLVQWLGIDDETLIATLLAGEAISNKLATSDAEEIEFKTGSSGTMWLFDASEPGDNLKGSHQVLALRPGTYRMRAAYFSAPGLMTVVRELQLQERVVRADDHQVMKIIATFERSNAPHKSRRLVVLQRKDGYFSFAEEYFYRSEYEGRVIAEGWARLPPEGIFETIEIAAAEALSSGRLNPSRDDTE